MGSLQWAKTDVFWYYEVVSCIGSCGLDKGVGYHRRVDSKGESMPVPLFLLIPSCAVTLVGQVTWQDLLLQIRKYPPPNMRNE
jgi:hypothetical protein